MGSCPPGDRRPHISLHKRLCTQWIVLARWLHCIPANTKHLYDICTMLGQRRRRWADAVQKLYECFLWHLYDICTMSAQRRRRWADVVQSSYRSFVIARILLSIFSEKSARYIVPFRFFWESISLGAMPSSIRASKTPSKHGARTNWYLTLTVWGSTLVVRIWRLQTSDADD